MPATQPSDRSRVKRFFRGLAIFAGLGLGGWGCFALGAAIGLAGVGAFACGLGVVVAGVAVLNCLGYGIYRLVEHIREKHAAQRHANQSVNRSHDLSSTSGIVSRITREQFGSATAPCVKQGEGAPPVVVAVDHQPTEPGSISRFFGCLFRRKDRQQTDVSVAIVPDRSKSEHGLGLLN